MNTVTHTLQQDGNTIVGYVPRLIGAVIILLIGYVIARVVGRIVAFLLKEAGLDRLGEGTGLADTLRAAGLPPHPSQVLGRLAYVIVLIAALVQTVDALSLAPLSQALRQLLEFAPHIVLAVLIVLGGALLGESLGRATAAAVNRANVLYHALIGTLVRVFVLLLAALLALQQLTIDATFLLAVLLVLLGGTALAMAIAFGWGARTLAENVVAARYVAQNFAIGDGVSVEGVTGTIERISPTSAILRTAGGGKAVIPNAILARVVV
ncbi:MAG TPA: mechanosensitive ion channel domain-containing protein, partial [Chloroflexota bacterium]|nr:mechanosensitive ion channel domain-containing protein [Chloroflexota bacterium]